MSHLNDNTVYMDVWFNAHFPQGAKHGFDVPEEIKAYAAPYWFTQDPVHSYIFPLFGIFFFFLWIVSTVGNGTVFFIFLKTRSLRTPSNMLIVALAVSDFIMMSTLATPLFVNMFMSKYWAFGELGCKIYGFLGGIFGTSSLWLIIIIGYDRYYVIVNGIGGSRMTPGKAFLLIIFAFTYSTLTFLPAYLEVWGRYALEGVLITCSIDYVNEDWYGRSYSLFLFIFNYFIPFIFICYFYSFIVKAVVVHEQNLKKQAKKMNVDSLRSNKNDKDSDAQMKIARVALTAVCLWLVAWTPYTLVVMISDFGPRNLVTPIASQFPSFFAKTASCMNPILYAISHPKYREALSKECPCFGIEEKSVKNTAEDSETRVTSS